mgnify:CR=1 FL=1
MTQNLTVDFRVLLSGNSECAQFVVIIIMPTLPTLDCEICHVLTVPEKLYANDELGQKVGNL